MAKGALNKTIDTSGCTALLKVIGLVLASIFVPVFAVYGLITGQTTSIPSRDGTDGSHWYSRATEPGGYWTAEAIWLLFGVLSIAIWSYILWSLFQPDKKPTAPTGQQIVPEMQGPEPPDHPKSPDHPEP